MALLIEKISTFAADLLGSPFNPLDRANCAQLGLMPLPGKSHHNWVVQKKTGRVGMLKRTYAHWAVCELVASSLAQALDLDVPPVEAFPVAMSGLKRKMLGLLYPARAYVFSPVIGERPTRLYDLLPVKLDRAHALKIGNHVSTMAPFIAYVQNGDWHSGNIALSEKNTRGQNSPFAYSYDFERLALPRTARLMEQAREAAYESSMNFAFSHLSHLGVPFSRAAALKTTQQIHRLKKKAITGAVARANAVFPYVFTKKCRFLAPDDLVYLLDQLRKETPGRQGLSSCFTTRHLKKMSALSGVSLE